MMEKKLEENSVFTLYSNLEKTAVLQEARAFNETPVNPKKCNIIMRKILYMLNHGEQLGVTEATTLFFAITKLFQSKDVVLRRLVYLGIKELSSIANDVIIVTSSLTKDMTGREDMYRAAAIRALCCITDATMLQAIERYMKQAIVDRASPVSCAAIVSSMHLLTRSSVDVVRRWSGEVQEALSADIPMAQYHALGLLYNIRRADRLAVTKLVSKLSRARLQSPHATCLLIRIAARLIHEENADFESSYFRFISSCLRDKSEMVVYEAARTVVNLRDVTPRELAPAISVLQMFCTASRSTLRFAAVRTLNQVAITHPAAVTSCNIDLEMLISDPNRSIATLAITTLLKTGSESSIDRLMKQISSFVSEISDEFKIVVVQAIKALCLKYPRKHGALMNFLSSLLRNEGGLDYKALIADTIITIIEENPEAKEAGLSHLCEFIEDCEHISLAVRILHLLGFEGPKTKQPSKYIRFIYNRVILESAPVRAAAVATLARFGALCDDLLPNVLVLLQRCQLDPNDEVRDRATFYHHLLDRQHAAINAKYILDQMHLSPAGLERALLDYCNQTDEEHFERPFDLASVPLAEVSDSRVGKTTVPDVSTPASTRPTVTRQDVFSEQLARVPELHGLGPLFKSSQPVDLTEPETEYVVQCIKHVFARHLVLQFDCVNTLSDHLLERVRVQLELPDGFESLALVECDRLEYNVLGTVYALLSLPEHAASAVDVCIGASLQFVVRDCDSSTGQPDSEHGYEDEYALEQVEVCVADHVQRLLKADFTADWERLGAESELSDTYMLAAMSSLEQAVRQIGLYTGMQACERSDKLADGRSSHTLLLAGVFRGGVEVLVRARLALSAEGSVTMQLNVRSTDPNISEVVASVVN